MYCVNEGSEIDMLICHRVCVRIFISWAELISESLRIGSLPDPLEPSGFRNG